MLKTNWNEYYESTVIPSIVLAGLSTLGESMFEGTMLPHFFFPLFVMFLVIITLNEGYDKIKTLRTARVSTTPIKNSDAHA